MTTRIARRVSVVALTLTASLLMSHASSSADSDRQLQFGGTCALHPDDADATVQALRFHCSVKQQMAIYRQAPSGPAPDGKTRGWAIPAPQAYLAPYFWKGKTFDTNGWKGGDVTNRLTPWSVEGFTGKVSLEASVVDGYATWLIDYTETLPVIYDEVREVTPGVYLGLAIRNTEPAILELTFVLQE